MAELSNRSSSDGATTEEAARPRRLTELLERSFDIRSFALTGLFILAVFYTVYFMRAVLLPIVLALLLSYLLRPLIRGMARAKIPAPVGATLLIVALIAAVVSGISALAVPASGWLEKAPYALQQLQQKLLPLRQPMEKVAQASGEIEKLTSAADPHAKPAVELKQHRLTDILFVRTPEFVIGALLVVILLYFLMAYDGVFLGKLLRLMPKFADKKRAVSIANEIQAHVSRYLLTQALINIALGTAVGVTVGLLGLQNPLMWGAMVAVLNFIPYLGAFTGIICMTLGAVLSYDTIAYAMIFPAVYLSFAVMEGNLITPWIMGRSLTLNPVIILISLTFWGWMWGIVGVILAVPILAAFKIFCSHVEPMEPIADFLS